jgi:Kef-type K+ transport system membrane component KefB
MDSLHQLAVIWASVYLANIAARHSKLTPVLFYLFFGCVLVNTGILSGEHDEFIRGFAELGIILIMFALGFEENSSKFVSSIKRSWGIAFFGAIAPFTTAYLVADHFWGDNNISLMCGLTMTATAVSLTMVSLKSEQLHNTRAALGIMTSAVLDDIASLALVAMLVPIAAGDAGFDVFDISFILFKALAFFAVVIVLGLWLLPHDLPGKLSSIPLIGKLGLKHLLGFGAGEYTTLTTLLVALLVGLLAHHFGFHPAIGAYMAGLIMKEEYFIFDGDTSGDNQYEKTRLIVDNVAYSWIGPVFFVQLGTEIVIDWQIVVAAVPETLAMTAGVLVTQVASAGLAARYTANFDWRESLLIGFGMLGRAELAFVVLDIAYVENSILSTEAFYTLMFTAFWLNVSVPISISLWKRYISRPAL